MQIGSVLEGLSLKERQNLNYMINYTAHLFHFVLEKKHLRGKSSEIVNRAFFGGRSQAEGYIWIICCFLEMNSALVWVFSRLWLLPL